MLMPHRWAYGVFKSFNFYISTYLSIKLDFSCLSLQSQYKNACSDKDKTKKKMSP